MQANVAVFPLKARLPPELGLGTFQRVEGVLVDAVELVKVIHGAGYVDLAGFGEEPQMPSWSHPAVAHVAVADSPMEAVNTLAADRRRARAVIALAGLVLAIAAAAGGALAAYLRSAPAAGGHATLVWAALDVSEAGLVVATPAGRVVVPVGGKLPNGDVVLSVHPTRRTAVLNSGTLVLHPERKARP